MNRRIHRIRQTIEEPVINLTPLIDVVFVILIMFILVAPLLDVDQVDLAYGGHGSDDKAAVIQESGPIRIHVRQDNTVLYNNRLVILDELTFLLQQDKQKYPNARPQVYHDRRAHFGVYQAIKNSAEEAGFEQLDIVLKPS